MSVSIGSIPATTGVSPVSSASASTSGGGVLPFSTSTTASGAYIAQGSGAPGSTGSSLVKKMLAGGLLGAGLGLGATFVVPGLREITMFGAQGWAAKGIIAAIGGAVGAVGAAAMHFIGQRKQNLALQAQAAMPEQTTAAQNLVPGGSTAAGVILRTNAKGGAATKLQSDLAALGLYHGKMTKTYDAATAAALKKYEVLKGVQPTGLATEEARTAIAADAALVKQHV